MSGLHSETLDWLWDIEMLKSLDRLLELSLKFVTVKYTTLIHLTILMNFLFYELFFLSMGTYSVAKSLFTSERLFIEVFNMKWFAKSALIWEGCGINIQYYPSTLYNSVLQTIQVLVDKCWVWFSVGVHQACWSGQSSGSEFRQCWGLSYWRCDPVQRDRHTWTPAVWIPRGREWHDQHLAERFTQSDFF